MSTEQQKAQNTDAQNENEETQEAEKVFLGQLDLTQLTKNTQSQNGLKHNDFTRYRQYCTNKLRRLRKNMEFSHMKGKKYISKKIEIEKRNDPKMLLVLLYNAERAWAYAMDFKQQINEQTDNRRLKYTVRKKFKKAAQWATLLVSVCTEATEKKTQLEAEAYCEHLLGLYNFEIEDWKQAQENFLKANSIYSELKNISDSLEGIVFQEKIESILQSLRYCNYQLGQGLGILSIDELIKENSTTNDPSLKEKFNLLIEEKRQQQVENSETVSITHFNETLPIKNKQIIMLMEQIKENNVLLEKQLQHENADDYGSEAYEKIIMLYVQLFQYYDDILKLYEKEKQEYKEQQNLIQKYNIICDYFTSQKLQYIISRNRLQLNAAIKKFKVEDGAKLIASFNPAKQTKLKTIAPFDIIRFCDNLLHMYKQYLDIEKQNPNLNFVKKIFFEQNYYQILRLFYVCLMYFQYQKYYEALSLFESFNNQITKLSDQSTSFNDLPFNFKTSKESLLEEINSYKIYCQAKQYQQLSVKPNLIEEHEDEEKKVNEEDEEEEEEEHYQQAMLNQYIEYPSISHKIVEEKKGFVQAALGKIGLGKIGGWFSKN